jgi:hypothetical protein
VYPGRWVKSFGFTFTIFKLDNDEVGLGEGSRPISLDIHYGPMAKDPIGEFVFTKLSYLMSRGGGVQILAVKRFYSKIKHNFQILAKSGVFFLGAFLSIFEVFIGFLNL